MTWETEAFAWFSQWGGRRLEGVSLVEYRYSFDLHDTGEKFSHQYFTYLLPFLIFDYYGNFTKMCAFYCQQTLEFLLKQAQALVSVDSKMEFSEG